MQSLQDQTGVTWNKRFKKQFGPINKVSYTWSLPQVKVVIIFCTSATEAVM